MRLTCLNIPTLLRAAQLLVEPEKISKGGCELKVKLVNFKI